MELKENNYNMTVLDCSDVFMHQSWAEVKLNYINHLCFVATGGGLREWLSCHSKLKMAHS